MRPITWDVKTLARGFASCCFEFVAREGNTTMHEMVSEGMKHSEDSFSVKDAQLRLVALFANLGNVSGRFGLLVIE
ncbi:hypothetical protein Goarm_004960, partial [Gossypium armourianum]|nr:hypothetical protein [Gossypium armourianum]